ncbi:MAG: 3-deoxy-7-phosphoheptulonate synthase [Clostridia bacterium]|nr:3-deoxy-7-phosphoheptulonate synthase [Clostridia bacterium]
MIILLKSDADQKTVTDLKEWLSRRDISIESAYAFGSEVIKLEGDLDKIDFSLIKRFDCVASITKTRDSYKFASRHNYPDDTVIRIGDLTIGGGMFNVIAGPCSVESSEQIKEIAESVKASGASILRGGAFKPRTSPYAFQGLKSRGIEKLIEAKKLTGMPIVSEIVDISALPFFDHVDIIQVGARNMQNFELLKELGHTRKPILLKRGPANTIEEFLMSAEYILAGGNTNVILCERGVRTFENMTRNTLDIASVPLLKKLTHLPVFADPSHSSGRADIVPNLALACCAAGADGVMVEVHNDPVNAFSDGAQSITPSAFRDMMIKVKEICPILGKTVQC